MKLNCVQVFQMFQIDDSHGIIIGKKLSDGKALGGAGRLTNERANTIQNFYSRAICDNKGDAKKMSKATHAILKHYSSTPEEPMHDDCPQFLVQLPARSGKWDQPA